MLGMPDEPKRLGAMGAFGDMWNAYLLKMEAERVRDRERPGWLHVPSHKQVFHHPSQPLVSCSRPRESLPLQSRTNNLFNLQVN